MIKKLLFLLLASLLLTGCGVRSIPQSLNQMEADWAEVLNQYKRRNDLIPNLVNTVKGYTSHERETLEAVVNARAKASQATIDASSLTPEKMAAFEKAQTELSSSLGKLMVVVERYPDLKASENFMALSSQLEGTENRIAIARRRYIDAVKNFNNLITVFPTNITNSLFFKHQKKEQLSSATESEQANPQVKF
ncbi:MAG: LemA family protein [Bacteriovoracaceae bacterium]|nr:LemA family protein [Bacteriovoracaceae bacterium]